MVALPRANARLGWGHLGLKPRLPNEIKAMWPRLSLVLLGLGINGQLAPFKETKSAILGKG
jgi:hypothetical protein